MMRVLIVRRYITILRVVIPYLAFSTLWILLSDKAAEQIAGSDHILLTQLQNVKGLAFVLASSLLIVWTLRSELLRKDAIEAQHREEVQHYVARLERNNAELEDIHEALIHGWARALELRDHETGGHTQRVTTMMDQMAEWMGKLETPRRSIHWGALLHDIGKMGVPDSILLKPGPLTSEERRVFEKHTEYARDFLETTPYLQDAITIPYCHHERWDGSGYPRGLKEKEIPIEARIFTVIDVANAMATDRPYRKALPINVVYAHLEEQAGQLYDPEVVRVFLSKDLLRRIFSNDLVPLKNK